MKKFYNSIQTEKMSYECYSITHVRIRISSSYHKTIRYQLSVDPVKDIINTII